MEQGLRAVMGLALLGCALLGCAAEADVAGDRVEGDGADLQGEGSPSAQQGAGGDVAGAPECIADHPATEPFDVGNVTMASRAPGSPGPEPEPTTAATIASECTASGGSGCDVGSFISLAAASCLAELNELDAGLAPWNIALVYHHTHRRVVWNVMSVMNDEGVNGYSGEALTLDATDGELLGRTGYRVTP